MPEIENLVYYYYMYRVSTVSLSWINYCLVFRHTLDIKVRVGMKVHKSGDHFRTVDCNEKLPYANSLEKRTLRNAHISTLCH